ncbi:MAG: HAD-IB family phosphatase [Gemmataceae bacterium]|nr:HAD-IB family phosphatase [Gemmataceae bacterium]
MTKRPGVLVSDFDGTITGEDFFRIATERFAPSGMEEYWGGYLSGRCTHFEALRGIFGTIRASEAELLEAVAQLRPEPELAAWVDRLHEAGWDVVVASAGCGWYIERVLAGLGLEVHCNPGRFSEAEGLVMELPIRSPYFSPTHGIDKAAVVRAAQAEGRTVAFAGDGFPDAPAARLVPEHLRFARADLAEALRREGLPFRPFGTWGEVARLLCAESPGG